MKPQGFRITAAHLNGGLANDLYEDKKACLWEIVRNGIVACMPNEKQWDTTRVRVDLMLNPSHVLNDKERALVVLDYGCGINEDDLERMRNLGATLNERRKGGSHYGAAQKRIGRFAALAMNVQARDGDLNQGFYYITRPSSDLDSILLVGFNPAQIERDQDIRVNQITLRHASLEFLRSIKGSFTACIIPNPVFANLDELRDALRWRLSRRQDLAMDIRVGHKPLESPPLSAKLVESTAEGDISAYIDRLDDDTRASRGPGIHFCDQETGLPVTTAMRLDNIPSPLWHPELCGDIFVPGLLTNQDTSRRGLRAAYLNSARWQRVLGFLIGQVCEPAKALLGDRYDFGSSSLDKSLRSLAEQCAAIWGEPDMSPSQLPFDTTKDKTGKSDTTAGTKGTTGTGTGTNPPKPRRPKALPIRIGDQTFWLVKMSMAPDQFAQVNAESPEIININERDYEGMPSAPAAQVEHILLRLVEAVAVYNHYESPQATTEIGQRILEFRSKTKGKKKK